MAGDDSSDEPPFVVTEELREDDAVEPPPDGGYGWVVVGACFTINCFSWGVTAVSFQIEPILVCPPLTLSTSPSASTSPSTS